MPRQPLNVHRLERICKPLPGLKFGRGGLIIFGLLSLKRLDSFYDLSQKKEPHAYVVPLGWNMWFRRAGICGYRL
jgi:hypothetical protein